MHRYVYVLIERRHADDVWPVGQWRPVNRDLDPGECQQRPVAKRVPQVVDESRSSEENVK